MRFLSNFVHRNEWRLYGYCISRNLDIRWYQHSQNTNSQHDSAFFHAKCVAECFWSHPFDINWIKKNSRGLCIADMIVLLLLLMLWTKNPAAFFYIWGWWWCHRWYSRTKTQSQQWNHNSKANECVYNECYYSVVVIAIVINYSFAMHRTRCNPIV